MSGYAKLYREAFLGTDLFRNHSALVVYNFALIHAAYKPKRCTWGTLEIGECDSTQKQIADGTGLSRWQVQRAQKALTKMGLIRTRTAHKTLVMTLVNTGLDGDDIPEPRTYRADNAHKSRTSRADSAHSIEGKKEEGEKEEELLFACADGVQDEFDALWNLWPPNERKNGKAACLKKFKALSSADRAACATGWREYCEIMTPLPAKHFVPLPATWINQRRWCDDRETWRKQRASWSGADKPSAFMHNARAEQGDKFKGMK